MKKQLEKIQEIMDNVMRGVAKETQMIVRKLKIKGREMVKRVE